MKKLLLLLLFFYNFSFAQPQTIQIKLVNANIGGVNYYNTPLGSSGINSTDLGLNQILSNYNVIEYYDGLGRPVINGQQDHYKYKMIDCLNCNISQLVTDLSNYSSVIEKVNISPEQQKFSDIVSFKLTDPTIGIPTGISNNVITTNSTILNQLFQTYNVYHYENFVNNTSQAWYYDLFCDCNIGELTNALLINNFIQPNATMNSNYFYTGVVHLLNNPSFSSEKMVVSPNPFSSDFDIQTEETILNYSLIDISGKLLIATTSKNELDTIASQLNSGIYFLNLQLENGKSGNFKLIKK